MARLARPRGRERLEPGPVAGLVLLVGQPAADRRRSASATSSCARPIACCSTQSGRRLAERAGVDLLRDRPDAAVLVELRPRRVIRLPQVGERSSAAPVLALEPRSSCERRRQPQDFGRVERRGSFPPPSSAARPVLQDDALGLELVADAVGGREVAGLLGRGAFGDASFDRRCIRARRLEPVVSAMLSSSPSKLRAGLRGTAGSSIADQRASSASGVLRSSRQRFDARSASIVDRARHRPPLR